MFVDAILDNVAVDLPALTTTLIDGYTVVNGSLVYVKNCSDGAKIGNIYSAAVTGLDIVWNFVETVDPGNWIYSTYGTIYSATTIIA